MAVTVAKAVAAKVVGADAFCGAVLANTVATADAIVVVASAAAATVAAVTSTGPAAATVVASPSSAAALAAVRTCYCLRFLQ